MIASVTPPTSANSVSGTRGLPIVGATIGDVGTASSPGIDSVSPGTVPKRENLEPARSGCLRRKVAFRTVFAYTHRPWHVPDGSPMISPRRRLILIPFVSTLLAACASPKPLDTTGSVAPETLGRARVGDGSAPSVLRDAAGGGSGSAEYATGLGLAEGWAGKKDIRQALIWWRRAAEQGNADAQNALAVAYAEGVDGPRNLDAARRLWEEAAKQGHAAAQYNLASLLAATAQTKGDMATAAEWLRRAAEGDPDAQYFLGNLYYNGEGVPRRQDEAVRLWRQAAAQGHADSAFSLGEAYLHGTAVPVDLVEAEKWMRKATSQGHGEAGQALALLSTGVVPETSSIERRVRGAAGTVRGIDDQSQPAIPRFKATPAVSNEPAPATPRAEPAKAKVHETAPRKPVRAVAEKRNGHGATTVPVAARAPAKGGGRMTAKVMAHSPAQARKLAAMPAKAARASPAQASRRPSPTAKVSLAKAAVPVAAPRQVAQAGPRPPHEKPGKSR
jgi:TPR repeat protein